jgi:Conjugal transfer protein
MRSMLIASVIALAAPMAHAAPGPLEEPKPGCGEMHGRLAVIHYKPLTLYECYLSPDIATSIIAAGGETVGPAGAADPEGLDVKKSANLLVVQPKPGEVNRSPNLTFETKTQEGVIRPYYFIFHVAMFGGVSAIQLVYDDDPIPGRPARDPTAVPSAQVQQIQRQQAIVASTLKTAPFYGGTNWAYDCMCASGRELAPTISDNAQDTIISYAGNTPANIVLARLDRDGTEKSPDETPHRETVVNFTPIGIGAPFIVPEVAAYWRIRSGNLVIDMRNNAYHPERVDQRTGTQSPAVVRVVRPTPVPKPPIQRAATAPRMANAQ